MEFAVGELMLFAPTAAMDVVESRVEKLGTERVRFRTRRRVTTDG